MLGHAALGQVALGQGGASIDVSASEAGSASETQSNIAVLAVALPEAETSSDSSNALRTAKASVSEAGTASDTRSAIGSFKHTRAETGSALDNISAPAIMLPHASETGAANDNCTSSVVVSVSISEDDSSLTDTCSGGFHYDVSVFETPGFFKYVGSMPGDGAITEFPVGGGLDLPAQMKTISDSADLLVEISTVAFDALAARDTQSATRDREDWGICIAGAPQEWTCEDEDTDIWHEVA